jgi:hypothetical protein
MAFLVEWHQILLARIPHKTADPARQAVLIALAERLNPAPWSDADRIAAGLQEAAHALERLSHVFTKRRRRTKRRTAGAPPSDSSPPPTPGS